MNDFEAIRILKRDLQIQKDNKCLPDGIAALEHAIKRLEEDQIEFNDFKLQNAYDQGFEACKKFISSLIDKL